MNGNGTTWTYQFDGATEAAGALNAEIFMQMFRQVAAPPVCACGAPSTKTLYHRDGRQTPACEACADRAVRESAIDSAPAWLEAAFLAVTPEQRTRLYRQLAIVFHPDQGGDERLMRALNAAREKHP